jgi:hypothetical protein
MQCTEQRRDGPGEEVVQKLGECKLFGHLEISC